MKVQLSAISFQLSAGASNEFGDEQAELKAESQRLKQWRTGHIF